MTGSMSIDGQTNGCCQADIAAPVSRRAAWIDQACAALWLIAEGHTPATAEHWAQPIPSFAAAPGAGIDAFTTISRSGEGRMDESKVFGWRIRELRCWRGLTLREAAGLAGLSFLAVTRTRSLPDGHPANSQERANTSGHTGQGVQRSRATRRALSTACCSSGLMTPTGSPRRVLITCSTVVTIAQP